MIDFVILTPAGAISYILPFEGISLTEELNKGYDGTLRSSYMALLKYAEAFNVTVDAMFASTPFEWRLRKDEVDIFGGILSHRTISGGAEGATSVQIKFVDYSGILAKRRTASEFIRTATDSATIVSDMISAMNAVEDTGLSMATLPTTKNRNITSRYANIRDEIVSMSNERKDDGYDWDVDVTKKININYPAKGTTRNGIIFDAFNTISWSSDRLLQAKLTNKAYVFGEGFGADMAVGSAEDIASQATWGLLEDGVSEKTVGSTTELDDRGTKFVDRNKLPTEGITLSHKDGTPDFTSYNVGDTVRVIIPDISFDDTLRIIKRTLDIDNKGEAIVYLTFEE